MHRLNSTTSSCGQKGKHMTRLLTVYDENFEAALQEALEILDKRFGTPSKIAERTMEDILSGKEVKAHDECGLWALINELRQCNAATKAVKGMAKDVWSANMIRNIIKQRCLFLKDNWFQRSVTIERAGKRIVKFLVEFKFLYFYNTNCFKPKATKD